jgi:hypothetical protein
MPIRSGAPPSDMGAMLAVDPNAYGWPHTWTKRICHLTTCSVQIAQLSRPQRNRAQLARNNLGKGVKQADRQEQPGSVPAVWSPVLVLAFMLALDPPRLALLLLLIIRPRPVQSLLAYWVGAATVSVLYMLVPLIVLHVTPGFRSVAQHASHATFGSPTVRYIQFGLGVVALLIAAQMAVRLRAGQQAYVATPADTASPLVADSNTPTAISQPHDRAPDAPTESGSPIRRLGARASGAWHRLWLPVMGAWESESPRAAFVVGLLSGPPPLTVLLVLTTIMASGAAIGTQVSLAIAWVVGMFAVVEIILVSYLVSPTKTETALRRLHDWVLAHRRQVWIAMIAVVGVVLLAYGMGVTRVGG